MPVVKETHQDYGSVQTDSPPSRKAGANAPLARGKSFKPLASQPTSSRLESVQPPNLFATAPRLNRTDTILKKIQRQFTAGGWPKVSALIKVIDQLPELESLQRRIISLGPALTAIHPLDITARTTQNLLDTIHEEVNLHKPGMLPKPFCVAVADLLQDFFERTNQKFLNTIYPLGAKAALAMPLEEVGEFCHKYPIVYLGQALDQNSPLPRTFASIVFSHFGLGESTRACARDHKGCQGFLNQAIPIMLQQLPQDHDFNIRSSLAEVFFDAINSLHTAAKEDQSAQSGWETLVSNYNVELKKLTGDKLPPHFHQPFISDLSQRSQNKEPSLFLVQQLLEASLMSNSPECLKLIQTTWIFKNPKPFLGALHGCQINREMAEDTVSQYPAYFRQWLASTPFQTPDNSFIPELLNQCQNQQSWSPLIALLHCKHSYDLNDIASEIVKVIPYFQYKTLEALLSSLQQWPALEQSLRASMAGQNRASLLQPLAHDLRFFCHRGYSVDIHTSPHQKKAMAQQLLQALAPHSLRAKERSHFEHILFIENAWQLAEFDIPNNPRLQALHQPNTLILLDESGLSIQEIERLNEIKEGHRLNGQGIHPSTRVIAFVDSTKSSTALRSRAIQLTPPAVLDTPSTIKTITYTAESKNAIQIPTGDDINPLEFIAKHQLHKKPALLQGLNLSLISHGYLATLLSQGATPLQVYAPTRQELNITPVSVDQRPTHLRYVCEHNFDYVLENILNFGPENQLSTRKGPLLTPGNSPLRLNLLKLTAAQISKLQESSKNLELFEILPNIQSVPALALENSTAKVSIQLYPKDFCKKTLVSQLPNNSLAVSINPNDKMHHLVGGLRHYQAHTTGPKGQWHEGPLIQGLRDGKSLYLFGLENNDYLQACLMSLFHSRPHIDTQGGRYNLEGFPGKIQIISESQFPFANDHHYTTPLAQAYAPKAPIVSIDNPNFTAIANLSKEQQAAWIPIGHPLRQELGLSNDCASRTEIEQQLWHAVQNRQNVMLLGTPATGKSSLIRQLAQLAPDKMTCHFVNAGLFGTTQFNETVQRWASATDSKVQILALDEASLLNSDQLRSFEFAYAHPNRSFAFHGDLYTLSKNHLVLAAGNHSDLPGRHISDFLKMYTTAMQVPKIRAIDILQNVINPLLNQSPLLSERSISHWREQLLQLQIAGEQLSTPDVWTPRLLQHLTNLAVTFEHELIDDGSRFLPPTPKDAEDFHTFALSYWKETLVHTFKNRLSAEDFYPLCEYLELNPVASPALFSENFLPLTYGESILALTPVADEIIFTLLPSFTARKHRLGALDTQPSHKGIQYCNFLYLEGEPGCGKDTITVATVRRCLDEYTLPANSPLTKIVHINVGPDIHGLENVISTAAKNGSIVILSELNTLTSQQIEGLLNDVTSGFTTDGQAVHPGFLVIATANSANHEGRELLSPALKSRAAYTQLPKLVDTNFHEFKKFLPTAPPNDFSAKFDTLLGDIQWKDEIRLQAHACARTKIDFLRQVFQGVDITVAKSWFFSKNSPTQSQTHSSRPSVANTVEMQVLYKKAYAHFCNTTQSDALRVLGTFPPYKLKAKLRPSPPPGTDQSKKITSCLTSSARFSVSKITDQSTRLTAGQLISRSGDAYADIDRTLITQAFSMDRNRDPSFSQGILNSLQTLYQNPPEACDSEIIMYVNPQDFVNLPNGVGCRTPILPYELPLYGSLQLRKGADIVAHIQNTSVAIHDDLDLLTIFDQQQLEGLLNYGQQTGASLELSSQYARIFEPLEGQIVTTTASPERNTNESLYAQLPEQARDALDIILQAPTIDNIESFTSFMAESLYYPHSLDTTLTQAYEAVDGPGIDAGLEVARVLFEKKRGQCTHAATAAAALIQHFAGLPTRMVEGFRTDASSDANIRVINGTPHAFIQVYVDDQWVAFDGTPQQPDTKYFQQPTLQAFAGGIDLQLDSLSLAPETKNTSKVVNIQPAATHKATAIPPLKTRAPAPPKQLTQFVITKGPIQGNTSLYLDILQSPHLKEQLIKTQYGISEGFKNEGDTIDISQLLKGSDRIFSVPRLSAQETPRKIILNGFQNTPRLIAPIEAKVLQTLADAGHHLLVSKPWQPSISVEKIWSTAKNEPPAQVPEHLEADEYLKLDCHSKDYTDFILACAKISACEPMSHWLSPPTTDTMDSLERQLQSLEEYRFFDGLKDWL